MSNLRQAAQQALEALIPLANAACPNERECLTDEDHERAAEALEALCVALAEPEQEPVRLQCTTCGTVYADGVPPQVSDYERGFVDGMNLQTKGSVDKAVNRMAQTTHWEGCEAVHPECRAKTELERKSDAIQRLWKERDELRALNAELVKALRGTFQEMLSVVASLNAEQMPHDGDEFHERLEKARAALAKVGVSNGS